MAAIANQRRSWVNRELAIRTKGTHISNKQRTKLMKTLWKQAKRDIN